MNRPYLGVFALAALVGCSGGEAGAPTDAAGAVDGVAIGDADESNTTRAPALDASTETSGQDAAAADVPDAPDAAIASQEVAEADGESPEADLPDADADAAGADSGDANEADVVLEPFVPKPPLACEDGAPRRLFDRIVVAGGTTLRGAGYLEPAATAFGPTFLGRVNAPLTVASQLGAAEIVVTSHDGAACRLTVLSSAGATLKEVSFSATSCSAPARAGPLLAIAVNDDMGGSVRWFAVLGLKAMGSAALPAYVSSPLALAGNAVLVGAGTRVVRVFPDGPGSEVETGFAEVRRVAVLEAGLGYVVGAKDESEAGLGGYFARLVVGNLPAVSELVAFPGAAMAEPIALGDCASTTDSAHWWCPGGLLVAGGVGWLSAYDLQGGAPRGEFETQRVVTGLSANDDGTVYSGGSPWTGGWDLSVADFLVVGAPALTELAGDTTGPSICVGSPLIEEDGAVVFLVGADVKRLATAGGELGPGWARSGGSLEGVGVPRGPVETCPGSEEHLFSRNHRQPDTLDLLDDVADSAPAPEAAPETAAGGLLVLGTSGPASFGNPMHLWSFRADGALAWSAVPHPGASVVEGAVGVASAGQRAVVAATIDKGVDPDIVRLEVRTTDGALVYHQSLPPVKSDPSVGRLLVGVSPIDEKVVALAGTAEIAGELWGWLARVDIGGAGPSAPLEDALFGVPPGTVLTGMTTGDGYVWVHGQFPASASGLQSGLVIGRPATGSGNYFYKEYVTATVERRSVDVRAKFGRTSIAERRFYGDLGVHAGAVLRLSLGGGESYVPPVPAEVELPFAPVALDFLFDGREVVLAANGMIAVLDGFSVDLLSGVAGPSDNFEALAVRRRGQSAVVLGYELSPTGTTDLRLVSTNVYGHTSCTEAGRCAGKDCGDYYNRCTLDSCAPSTGACSNTARDDGTPCGIVKFCQAGVCL